jgi:hypothetical protein
MTRKCWCTELRIDFRLGRVAGMIVRILAIFLSVLSCVGCSAAQSRPESEQVSIRVRLIDEADGSPVRGVYVGLSMVDEKGKPSYSVSSKTNKEGVATFQLTGAEVTDRVGLFFGIHEFGSCSDVQFSSTAILNTGTVSKNRCKHDPSGKFHAAAGELVTFGHPVTLLENILREI